MILKKLKNLKNKTLYYLYRKLILSNKIKNSKCNIFIIGTPEYDNLGDHMIAVAQEYFIKKYKREFLEIPESAYESFKNNIKDNENNLIFLQGGGNLGNEYMLCQDLRNDIIKSFPKSKIVLMPQTIYFTPDEEGNKELQKTIDIYSAHKNLTLCAREQVSYNKMKDCFKNNKVILTPDIVLSSEIDKTTKTKRRKQILFLTRKDKEKVDHSVQMKKIKEWAFQNGYCIKYSDTVPNCRVSMLNRKYKLNKIFKTIKQSEFVVTDRLHGMIFSYINNTPAIVFSNYNHKIQSSYEWIKSGKVALYNDDFDISKFLKEVKEKDNFELNEQFDPLKREIINN